LDEANRWAGYVAGVPWALGQRGHRLPALDISVDGDVPAGVGLSSSAALECAVVASVAEALGLTLARPEWVEVARQAENEFVGAPTGGMDQLASVFGEAGRVLLCDMRSLGVTPLPFDLGAEDLSLLVVDSRAPHQLTDGLYGDRRAACERAAGELGVATLRDVPPGDLDAALASLSSDLLRKRARHVIGENERTLQAADLLARGRVREIGPLLTASHVSLRDDFEVSVPEVDLAVETMLEAGAYGSRITGGGFGGCAIGLIDASRAARAIAAVEQAFADSGYRAPQTFLATPSQGTHRL
jgi:galactokinase